MKICPNCGHANADDVKFCENCGTGLAATEKRCPRCQTLNPQANRFCENCGYDFTTAVADSAAIEPAEPAETAKTTATPQSLAPTPTKASTSDGPAASETVATPPDRPTADSASASSTASETVGPADTAATEATPSAGPAPATSTATGSTAPTRTPTPEPAPQTPKRKSKWQWLVSGLILLVLIGGGAYFLTRDTHHSAKPATSRTTKKVASSSAATSKSASASTTTFDQSQIEDEVTTALNGLSGTTSAYVSPVDQNKTVLVNNGAQSSASSIKIFILVTAYAMAKEGVFDLDETHTLTSAEKVGGTGELQNMSSGTKLTYREILGYMIDSSDNTAANIIMDKLGGFDLINNKIKSMGATNTKLRRKMMDTDAIEDGRDNTTSARDLGVTLKKMYNHQLVSKSADTAMLDILAKNTNRTKLPKDLPSTAKVYNKTGEFADYGVQNDAEIVANRHGAFVAVVLSQDGQEADQIAAMNDLGLKLYQDILE